MLLGHILGGHLGLPTYAQEYINYNTKWIWIKCDIIIGILYNNQYFKPYVYIYIYTCIFQKACCLGILMFIKTILGYL